MTKGLLKKDKGFTIIEVVLVLAIAGLIFLIVFLALPQLQKSRRDTQRRNDGGRMVSSLESWAGNNNGNYPTSTGERTSFLSEYITDQINTPDGNNYSITWGTSTNPGGTDNVVIAVGSGTDCDGNAMSGRTTAVRVGLEQGVYCQDNK